METGIGWGAGTGLKANEGTQDETMDGLGSGAGTGTGTDIETRRRSQRIGTGTGTGTRAWAVTERETRTGTGRAEARRRSARNCIRVVNAMWKTRETWVESEENVEKKVLVQ